MSETAGALLLSGDESKHAVMVIVFPAVMTGLRIQGHHHRVWNFGGALGMVRLSAWIA